MEYKIYVFNDDKLQDIGFDFSALQKIMAGFNASILSFAMLKHDNENLAKLFEEKTNLILFFKNQEIDNVICDQIKNLGNQKNIIDEQIVVFNKDENKIIFVPYDTEWISLLSKVNLNPERGNKTCAYKLFGIQKQQTQEILNKLSGEIENLKYTILSKGLLTDVYISYTGSNDMIDDSQVKIASALKQYIYSENSLELAKSIRQLIALKGLKLNICEGVTGGALLKEICSGQNFEDILKEGKLEFLKGDLTADSVYKQTLNIIEGESDDVFAINVQGQFQNDGITCIYAIGNSKSIDVYKNSFKVKHELAVKYAVDAIMFNVVKKLRQNNLSF